MMDDAYYRVLPGSPGPHPAVETARQEYLDVRATADRQLEAMGGVAEIGTDAGDQYAALDSWAADKYVQYVDVWAEANPPEPEPEPDPQLEVSDPEIELEPW